MNLENSQENIYKYKSKSRSSSENNLNGNDFVNKLSPELEEGNIEYKYKLTNLTTEQLQHRITQLNWRLNEGNNIAVYEIGVHDNGYLIGE